MNYKQRQILKNTKKRFQTTIIGALARFEKNFSYLWDSDSKQAEEFYELWQETRNEILNHGNSQSRAGLEDLENFMDINSKYKHQYKFYNKDKENYYYE